MKRIAIALLLTVALCGSAFAQQIIVGCPDGPNVVEETVDIDLAVEQVVKSADAEAQKAYEAAAKLGQPADMAVFGISQALAFLKHRGVAEDTLAPLVEARDTLAKALEGAIPNIRKGAAVGSYAAVLAEGSNADKLRAAALYLDAAEQFKAGTKALEGTDTVEAGARKVFEAIMEELNKPDKEPAE